MTDTPDGMTAGWHEQEATWKPTNTTGGFQIDSGGRDEREAAGTNGEAHLNETVWHS